MGSSYVTWAAASSACCLHYSILYNLIYTILFKSVHKKDLPQCSLLRPCTEGSMTFTSAITTQVEIKSCKHTRDWKQGNRAQPKADSPQQRWQGSSTVTLTAEKREMETLTLMVSEKKWFQKVCQPFPIACYILYKDRLLSDYRLPTVLVEFCSRAQLTFPYKKEHSHILCFQ